MTSCLGQACEQAETGISLHDVVMIFRCMRLDGPSGAAQRPSVRQEAASCGAGCAACGVSGRQAACMEQRRHATREYSGDGGNAAGRGRLGPRRRAQLPLCWTRRHCVDQSAHLKALASATPAPSPQSPSCRVQAASLPAEQKAGGGVEWASLLLAKRVLRRAPSSRSTPLCRHRFERAGKAIAVQLRRSQETSHTSPLRGLRPGGARMARRAGQWHGLPCLKVARPYHVCVRPAAAAIRRMVGPFVTYKQSGTVRSEVGRPILLCEVCRGSRPLLTRPARREASPEFRQMCALLMPLRVTAWDKWLALLRSRLHVLEFGVASATHEGCEPDVVTGHEKHALVSHKLAQAVIVLCPCVRKTC